MLALMRVEYMQGEMAPIFIKSPETDNMIELQAHKPQWWPAVLPGMPKEKVASIFDRDPRAGSAESTATA